MFRKIVVYLRRSVPFRSIPQAHRKQNESGEAQKGMVKGVVIQSQRALKGTIIMKQAEALFNAFFRLTQRHKNTSII